MLNRIHGLSLYIRLPIVFSFLLFLSACANTATKSSISNLYQKQDDLKILLMPIDVELSVLTAGGVLEPRSDWTEAAMKHMKTALSKYQTDRGAKLINFEIGDQQEVAPLIAEIERLHSAVGISILTHEFVPALKLPSKDESFDWSLGTDVTVLKEKYDADYALFVFVRDSYSSSGRVALTVVAALLGVGIANGQQVGFASLVDLDTGKVSWFNRLFSTTGDLRTEEPAAETVKTLLAGLPQ
jgi:hypothetical protein